MIEHIRGEQVMFMLWLFFISSVVMFFYCLWFLKEDK
jgi:hypothetical protein